jgi:hypothetical protein
MPRPTVGGLTLIPKDAAALLAHNKIQIPIAIDIGQIGLPEIPTFQLAIAKMMNKPQLSGRARDKQQATEAARGSERNSRVAEHATDRITPRTKKPALFCSLLTATIADQ